MVRHIHMLVVAAVGAGMLCIPQTAVLSASKHNGACVGFAGSVGGHKFAGLKCYLDEAPGNWVIRYTVKERDNKDEFGKLIRLPKKPIRCMLTKGKTSVFNGMESTNYNISNC